MSLRTLSRVAFPFRTITLKQSIPSIYTAIPRLKSCSSSNTFTQRRNLITAFRRLSKPTIKSLTLPLHNNVQSQLSSFPPSQSTSTPIRNQSTTSEDASSKVLNYTQSLLTHLQHAKTVEIFHYTNVSLAVLTPVAIFLSPTFLNIPVDFALGLIIPIHAHIGSVGVIQDYVPRPQQPLAIAIFTALTLLTFIGLLKINLCGAGITESVKSLWRKPVQVKEVDRHQVKATEVKK